MLLRRLTDYILASRMKGIGVSFISTLLPVPGLGMLVASLVTLRKGAFEGSLVFCATIAATLLQYLLVTKTPETAWLMSLGIQLGCLLGFLTWLLVLVLRVTGSWALVVESGALIALAVITGLHWVFPHMQAFWVKQLTSFFTPGGASGAADLILPAGSGAASRLGELSAQQMAGMIAGFSQYATGFMVTVFLFNTLLQVILARAWESMLYAPGKMRAELYHFRPGWITASVTIVLLVLDLAGVRVAIDLLPVLVMVFLLAGLSLLHYVFSRVRGGWLWIVLMYVGIALMFPWSIIVIAIPGLLDVWLDFRGRLNALKK